MTGFKNFLLRGNLVETAVALIMALAFASVVSTFTAWLMSLIPGLDDVFDPSTLSGQFLNALLAFLIIAAVIFFLVIKPVNALQARRQPSTAVDVPTRPCPECLSDIPLAATRCAFCTAKVSPTAPRCCRTAGPSCSGRATCGSTSPTGR